MNAAITQFPKVGLLILIKTYHINYHMCENMVISYLFFT